MSTLLPRSAFVLAVAAIAGSGLACSSSSNESSTTTTVPAAAAAAKPISVHMTEWKVEPAATTAPAGSVTFEAHNGGTKTHELALIKTDLPADQLPVDEDGAVEETGAGVELVEEVEDVGVGAAKPFTATVTPGNYYLVCNLVDADTGDKHFSHQMYAPFKVT